MRCAMVRTVRCVFALRTYISFVVRRCDAHIDRTRRLQRLIFTWLSQTNEYTGVLWSIVCSLFIFKLLLNFTRQKVGLNFIDHCVGNQPDLEMENTAKWYARTFVGL